MLRLFYKIEVLSSEHTFYINYNLKLLIQFVKINLICRVLFVERHTIIDALVNDGIYS